VEALISLTKLKTAKAIKKATDFSVAFSIDCHRFKLPQKLIFRTLNGRNRGVAGSKGPGTEKVLNK